MVLNFWEIVRLFINLLNREDEREEEIKIKIIIFFLKRVLKNFKIYEVF